MNKITTSTKVGLLSTGLILLVFTVYLSFFRGTSPQTPSPTTESRRINIGETTGITLGQGSSEFAPMYSDIESDQATIQISEETRNQSPRDNSESTGNLPQGFGLGSPNTQGQAGQSPLDQQLEALPIDLETPLDSTVDNQANSNPGNTNPTEGGISTMDPREVGVTANDGPDKDYEETVLTVQRTLTAVNPDGEKQLIRLKIPVMYRSKTLHLHGETKVKAQEILQRLKTKGEELAKIKLELEETLVDWNQLVIDATPYEILLPESPTLPQNQSAGRLNRDDNPSMSAGKAISYEIINK
jgi:hypothetical protein